MNIVKRLKRIFWKIPLPPKIKEKFRKNYLNIKEICEGEEKINFEISKNSDTLNYTKQILSIPNQSKEYFKEYEEHKITKKDFHIIAYYLTQFHPTPENDLWWGKGTTEWNNVTKAVPQFCGHYQPRFPGELGYYDLRIKENMKRQIELAQNYGVDVFCFYYYWFNGKRLLEKPLDMFLNNKELNMNFCICWVNQNWTKRFSGSDSDALMEIGKTKESYISFVYDILDILNDNRYFCIKNKPVLLIYRPSLVPNLKEVLKTWRDIVKRKINKEIYIIAVQEKGDSNDWCKEGFDAETEFQPKRINNVATDITDKVQTIRKDFKGVIYDYKDLVENKRYILKRNLNKKVYYAVMPMWDNTARRNNRGRIYYGSTPELYKKWLKESIKLTKKNEKLDEKMLFVNAWNEWGEGAYLEPDQKYGYAYLESTYEALNERNKD